MGREDLTNRAQLTLTLDKKIIEYLRNYSKETGIPISRYVDRVIEKEMSACKDGIDSV